MFEDRARRADGRRRVGVLVSVDADDDTKIPMESQHAVRSLAKRKDIDPRPERRCGKTVMSHTRKGGQASDQANARQPGPAPEQGRTSPIEGTIRGPISFWVTSLPPAPVSDAASQNRRNPDSQSVLNQHDIPPALPAPSPTAGARSSHRPQRARQNQSAHRQRARATECLNETLLQSH